MTKLLRLIEPTRYPLELQPTQKPAYLHFNQREKRGTSSPLQHCLQRNHTAKQRGRADTAHSTSYYPVPSLMLHEQIETPCLNPNIRAPEIRGHGRPRWFERCQQTCSQQSPDLGTSTRSSDSSRAIPGVMEHTERCKQQRPVPYLCRPKSVGT